MSSAATYTADGNYTATATDALGNVTTYCYNDQTGVLEWVQGPKDTAATRTNYTYDEMYRTATASATTDTGLNMSVQYTYENDMLTKLKAPGTTYGFEYGDFGLREKVTIGGRTLVEYSYTEQNNYLQSIDYGNGDSVQYTYDEYGRLLYEMYEDGDKITYQYGNDGAIAAVYDSASGITTRQYYDLTGRNVGYSENGQNLNHRVTYEYDSDNNLGQLVETIGTHKTVTSYEYDDDDRTTKITTDGITVEYTYDDFGRVTQQVTKQGDTVKLTEYFTYTAPTATTTSGQVATYRTVGANVDITYTYTYDENGNITSVYNGSKWVYYTYDSANQLIREDNQRVSRTYTWIYDNAGNIEEYKVYPYSHGTATENLTGQISATDYQYDDEGWGDLLTGYNGSTVTYDGSGNPKTLNGRSYTWEHGRQLETMTMNGVTWTYAYNNAGLRTGRVGKNGNTIVGTYEYIYNGSQLVRMVKDGEIVDFTYDAAGTPLTMTYDGNTYYYVVNLQGDVEGLLDESGNRVLTYYYTAYGQAKYIANEHPLTNTLININPLGYRGYVFDVGTGLYYLQSRYYDPTIGRFINADGLVATGQGFTGNNMFAYCLNNPVQHFDPMGHFPWIAVILVVGGAIIGGIAGAKTNKRLVPTTEENKNKPLTTKDKVENVVVGATAGGAVGGTIALTAGATTVVVGGAEAIMVLGGTARQTCAIGAVAYNVFVMFVAPILGIEAEPIELPS